MAYGEPRSWATHPHPLAADLRRLPARALRCVDSMQPEISRRNASDAVQQQSLFWVVTRSLNCFYCMGHTEMSLEVAGLDRNAIAERTRRLGSGDWSAFPAAERAAFAFAEGDEDTVDDHGGRCPRTD